jgi:alcohol dehydrogenase
MIVFEKRAGLPTELQVVAGFNPVHIDRSLAAAREPQLRMDLENMPVPLKSELEGYMWAVLQAATNGNHEVIRKTQRRKI